MHGACGGVQELVRRFRDSTAEISNKTHDLRQLLREAMDVQADVVEQEEELFVMARELWRRCDESEAAGHTTLHH